MGTRLYLNHPLAAEQSVNLSREQAHYLFNVMRLGEGAALRVFNGRDGEWSAVVQAASKRGGTIRTDKQTALQTIPPDLWLMFAPIKKARTDFIVEKAVELGARRILPVQTAHTNSERIRRDRLQAHAVEAAEQCGATYVPHVAELTRLETLLRDWPPERALIFADEARAGQPADALPKAPAALLIGPEGGFSEAERTRLRSLPQIWALSLGPRILRADTAAVAGLALWQNHAGDW